MSKTGELWGYRESEFTDEEDEEEEEEINDDNDDEGEDGCQVDEIPGFEGKCVWCYTRERDRIFIPCAHILYCGPCLDLLRMQPEWKNTCPFDNCRQVILTAVKKYEKPS